MEQVTEQKQVLRPRPRLPWKKILSFLQAWWRPAVTRLLFYIGPLISLFIVETLNEKNPFTNLSDQQWWMNLVLYAIVWLVLWLIFGRRRRAAAAGACLFFFCGLANHYVLKFKGIVLFPHDIASWRTAANVAGTYDFSPDQYIWGALAILAAYLLLLYFVALPQKKRSYCRIKWLNLVPVAAAAAYCYMFFFSSWLIDAGIKTQQWKTQSNGWVLNFSLALRYGRVEKPENYSDGAVDALTEALSAESSGSITLVDDPYMETAYEPDTLDADGAEMVPSLTVTGESASTQPLNIICIMNESFADLSVFEALSIDQDSIPFYHSLTENTIKGWMYSPVTGGGTASVEYEFLTGNSISFLPPGTVAYQLYVKSGMPSLISWANALGFETTTFHPYEASGWNRMEVYSDFGADNQLYQEDVTDPQYVRSYISDQCDFDVIKSITSKAEGDKQFIFNVTMQNHGGYKQGWNNLEQSVTLTGAMAGISEYATQYLALMHKTDEALEELLDYYSSIDEPTMIVFFGDHQGSLSDWFYARLYGKQLDDRDMEELERQYVVPFFFWANYDIDEAQDVMISTNYLGALLGQLSGYPTTGYMDFLSDLYEVLPVMNKVGYITADGQIAEDSSELGDEVQEKLNQYAMLSYYNLFGSRDAEIDARFFSPQQ